MMKKPSIPQGTRDFDAATVQKRQYILHTIKTIFELYGYQPLETPAMENLETLTGKYGEEGDTLIFKILNNGLNHPAKADKIKSGFDNILSGKNSRDITERALRYDLTIPFARYVSMNYSQLPIPFKRYQMQPVWRADRPQKGRYREFYQCDADVVGSPYLLNELELIRIFDRVFQKLNINVEIRINNRKILAALADLFGVPDQLEEITIAIDKLEKVGIDKVKESLFAKNLTENQVQTITRFLNINGNNNDKLQQLQSFFSENETGRAGIEELEYIIKATQDARPASLISLDPTLARGLNYYTGTIFEVKASDVQMGSIAAGGRYDNLTGLFGVPDVSGVGISFGVDRMYDVMSERNLFPKEVAETTRILFFNLGEVESAKAMELAEQLRSNEVRCEVFHENTKFEKQFKYAEKKGIPYVAILGSKELEKKMVNIKNLATGAQHSLPFAKITDFEFSPDPV